MDITEQRYRIRNWDGFQHFKDRCPPWIKLYRDLVDNPDWHDLDGETAKILIMLWLVASEDPNKQGFLPDVRKLSFRLRISDEELLTHIQLLERWVSLDSVTVISNLYQDDAPETETETETERERETEGELESVDQDQQPNSNEIRRREEIKLVIGHLNEKLGSKFRPSSAKNKKHINARLNDGMTVEELCLVVDDKIAEWRDDKKMAHFLRPETLFGTKCEGYLQAINVKKTFTSQPSRVKLCKNCKHKLTCNMVMTTGHCGKHEWENNE